METFASTLLGNLIKVMGFITVEYKKFKGGKEAVNRLEITIIKAQDLFNSVNTSLLEDARRTDTLHNRLETLAVLCLDAEDLIEDKIGIVNHNSTSFWPLKNLSCPYDTEDLQKKLDSIFEQVKSIVEHVSNQTKHESIFCDDDGDHTKKLSMRLIGREEDITYIVQRLISDDSVHFGVSILGMDGLGKTMLAKAILEDKRILAQFTNIVQVPLLKGCLNFKEVTNKLSKLQQGSNGKNGILKYENQRSLIFFDNLLNLSFTEWNDIWDHVTTQLFANTKILITTFNPRVSKITRTIGYYLTRLSDENCKQVIVQKALLLKKNLPASHLSHIAGTLATKCEGLPVLARILGIVLAQYDIIDWANILNKDLRDMSEVKREIVSTLRLTYLTMQPQLQECLAYFSLFPHKYPFNMDDLIHLWVGQGIIQPGDGDEYFSDLQGMSILQRLDNVNHTGKSIYEFHKSTHIFSQWDASKIYMQLNEEGIQSLSGSSSIDGVRHLSLLCGDFQPGTWAQLERFKRLRTFLSLNVRRIGRVPPRLFKALVRLRVLNLKDTDITELPDSIDRLKRLRNLDISCTPINSLPETLCKLSNLQFLNLKNTSRLSHLPQQFQKLTKMLWLDWELNDITRLTLPSHIGKLSSLQTLPLFTVGDDQKGFSIAELKNMTCLQGSICIRNLENVKSGSIAKEAMLSNKPSLKKIELQWMSVVNDMVAKDVLTSLEPHFCLTELNVINYGGKTFPEWISAPSRSLQKIHLMKCLSCDVLPSLGKLETLEILVIEEFASLTSVDRCFCGSSSVTRGVYFPSLESLTFKNLAQLQEWTGLEENDLPRLRILKLVHCPELIRLPSLRNLTSLVELQIERCPVMRALPELPASLKSLKIRESNLLKDRCAAGGEDWQKIDCIPEVEIDDMKIQTSGASSHVIAVPASPDWRYHNIVYRGYQLVKDNFGAFSRIVFSD